MNNFFQEEGKKKEVMHSVPLSLFMMSRLRKEGSDDQSDNLFESHAQAAVVIDILQQYSQCVLDISLNEVSVHSINHTKSQVGQSYLRLEKKLVRQNRDIYDNIHPIKHGLDFLEDFLSSDCMIISKIFINKTFSHFINQAIEIQTDILRSALERSEPSGGGTVEVKLMQMESSPRQRSGEGDGFPFRTTQTREHLKTKLLDMLGENRYSSEEDSFEEQVKKSNSHTLNPKSRSPFQPIRSVVKKKLSTFPVRRNTQDEKELFDEQASQKSNKMMHVLVRAAHQVSFDSKCQARFTDINSCVLFTLNKHCVPLNIGDDSLFYDCTENIKLYSPLTQKLRADPRQAQQRRGRLAALRTRRPGRARPQRPPRRSAFRRRAKRERRREDHLLRRPRRRPHQRGLLAALARAAHARPTALRLGPVAKIKYLITADTIASAASTIDCHLIVCPANQ